MLKRCVLCRRHCGSPFRLPDMPPSPKARVTNSTSFQFTALDYLGPVFVKKGPKTIKMWICLFTCIAVRAIHLEWVRNLSAKQFLDSVRRIVSRRGKPEQIISNNAPQFKLTMTFLDHQWQRALTDEEALQLTVSNGVPPQH